LGVALPATLVVLALLPLVLFEARMPEPLASHWGLRGTPNGAMAHAKLLFIVAVIACGAALIMCFSAFRRSAGRGEITSLMALAGFMGGLVAALSWTTTRANLDATTWQQASHLGIGQIMVPVGMGIALAALVARFSRALETASPVEAGTILTAGLAPGARAIWVGTARATWAAPVAIIILAIGVFTQIWKPAFGFIHLAVGLLCLLFTSICVTVDRNGVRIAYGLLHWPVQRVALGEIQQASMLQVKPLEWGGWGYRGSLKLMRRAAIVLRAGQGIRLELAGDRTLVITVDDAEQAAGVINDLIGAQRRKEHL
jgi:hypothetical protein